MARFFDRADAGRRLTERVEALGLESPVVLGLPRGGVVVAAEVAAALGAGLEAFVVRKVGSPGHEALGIGAIAEGLAEPVVSAAARDLGVGPLHLLRLAEPARTELDRRVEHYRADRDLPALEGRDVVLVDDGSAVDVTAEAALRALRDRQPRRLVMAVPVCAGEAAARLARIADDVVCAASPSTFFTVAQCYDRFEKTTDEEVLDQLERWHPVSGRR